MPITYGSVCSGIEAATVAWHPLGWQAAWYAEIEPFPCAVLAHHYPNTPNHGDMTRLAAMVLAGKIPAPDALVGGTPCQAFSVAGMREGLADPRGALTIKYVELLDAIDHVRTLRGEPEAVCVWENVPGVLSDKGNAFGCFLGALVGESEELQPPGGKWKDAGCVYGPTRTVAWRILDAQYFGLAQRRRRVFVVASARAGFDPLEVLFEREGVRRDTPPRRSEGQGPASTITRSFSGNGGIPAGNDCQPRNLIFGGGANCRQTDVATALSAHPGGTRMDAETETFVVAGTLSSRTTAGGGLGTDFETAGGLQVVTGTLQANGKAAGSATQQDAESGMLVIHGTQDPCTLRDQAHTLGRNSGQENAVFDPNQITSPANRSIPEPGLCHTLPAASKAPIAFSCKNHGSDAGQIAPTLRAMGHGGSHPNAGGQVAVCITGKITHTLKAEGFDASEDGTGRGQPTVQGGAGVRRLTPRECEWLQGFPSDHTQIPYRGKPAEDCPDGPRYKAIGNSKAVLVVRWIGLRIQRQLTSSAV
ncbi:DNA cytosine methyltransferase [Pseudomonas sp. NPDC087612]|uniref:DNA cytosine methyltransferase n=1 Tax=Pseudomonas sp. NPDC087612 TaxID=3364441 RepID=UPI0037FA57E7